MVQLMILKKTRPLLSLHHPQSPKMAQCHDGNGYKIEEEEEEEDSASSFRRNKVARNNGALGDKSVHSSGAAYLGRYFWGKLPFPRSILYC